MDWTRLFLPLFVLGFALVVTPAFGDVIVDGSDGQADLGPPDCTGTSPAPTTISDGLASTTSGETVWVCPATYGETVVVDTPNVTVRSAPSGDSTNVVVRAPNTAASSLSPALLIGADNVNVVGMRFRNGFAGVAYFTVSGGLVRDVRADSNTNGVVLLDSSGVEVTESRLDDNDTNGVVLQNADSSAVSGNVVRFNGLNGINLRDGSTGNVVFDNAVDSNALDGISFFTTGSGAVSNRVENNRVRGNAAVGIFVGTGGDSNLLVDNRVARNGVDGAFLDGVDDNVLRGNVVENNVFDGIRIDGGGSHVVRSNRVRFNGRPGLNVLSASGNEFRDNTLHSNGIANINLNSSTNNGITSNVLRNGAGSNDLGVVFEGGSSGNSLKGNRIELHDSAGVKVVNSASNTFKDNFVDTNTFGVWLHNADDHQLESNRIRDNDTGIVVSGTASDSEISNVAQLNIIAGNGQGIVNSTVRIFDARRVYWGASSGPSGGNTDPFTGATASGAGDEIASPGVPDTNVAFAPFLASTNLPGGGGAGTAEECLIQRMDPPSAGIKRIRSLRDELLNSRLGRWITRGYYRASAGLVSSGFPGAPHDPDRPRQETMNLDDAVLYATN